VQARQHRWLHPLREQGARFLQVDDIEPDSPLEPAHLEVKPLSVAGRVHIVLQQQVELAGGPANCLEKVAGLEV
jgi:hypothetical protein